MTNLRLANLKLLNPPDDIPPEFWHHIEVVTGTTIPDDERPTYFRCAC